MAVYALTIFLGAFLLFQVQPIIAKYILPWFGGTPAVWSTCMLFFQVFLLGGYSYAHWLSSRFRPRTQGIIHPAIIAASLILMILLGVVWQTPITPASNWKTEGSETPIWNIILVLAVAVGLPYFLLAATSPLLQSWFSRRYPARSPYRLFSLSNAGSLVALLGYPFIVEPALRLRTQAWIWSTLYLIFAGLCAYLALRARTNTGASESTKKTVENIDQIGSETKKGRTGHPYKNPSRSAKIMWVLLAAAASVMLLAVTNQLCQEIAVIPFLWVLPLSIYLITFIICFAHENWYSRWYVPAFVIAGYYISFAVISSWTLDILLQIAIYSPGLFVFCIMCHGELAKLKPHPKHLTSFYLCVSIGGAMGGIFVALIAPRIFNGYWELHLGIVACFVLIPYSIYRDKKSWVHSRGRLPAFIFLALTLIFLAIKLYTYAEIFLCNFIAIYGGGTGIIIAVLYFLFRRRGSFVYRRTGLLAHIGFATILATITFQLYINYSTLTGDTIHRSRNFFGVLRIDYEGISGSGWERHELALGTTVHGLQFTAAEKRGLPTSYYSPQSGLGLILTNHPKRTSDDNSSLRIGDVGLGVGTLAVYAQKGDYLCFYEINPRVSSLALGEKGFFSYIADCPANVDIVLGDGRLSLERQLEKNGPMQFDILVLDAFNSNAVPIHLLTREAFEIYLKHLVKDGILIVNVSNNYLRLDPVVWNLAEYFDLDAVLIKSEGNYETGSYGASWMLLSHDKEVLKIKEITKAAAPKPDDTKKFPLWTDNYSNLFKYLK